MDDPLFVKTGLFDFQRFNDVVIRGRELQMPDFIVEEPDYRLRTESPCVDAGTPDGAPTFDIEGQGRPCGSGVDMGAYEMGGCPEPMPFRRGDPNADGRQNISDAVWILRQLFRGGAPSTCEKSADANDTGDVDLTDAVHLLEFLFLAGPTLEAPFRECGCDLTIDELTCDSFAPCK